MSTGPSINQEALVQMLLQQQLQQQQQQKPTINWNVILLAVIIIGGIWFINQQRQPAPGPAPTPDTPVVTPLSQQIDNVFSGSSTAAADKLYFGNVMRAIADSLQADQQSRAKSFEQVGDIRGPLAGELSRFIRNPRLKSLPADKMTTLASITTSKLQLSGKDADALSSDQMNQVINWFRELAQASGVK